MKHKATIRERDQWMACKDADREHLELRMENGRLHVPRLRFQLLLDCALLNEPEYVWHSITQEQADHANEALASFIRRGRMAARIATPGWTDEGYDLYRNSHGMVPPAARAFGFLNFWAEQHRLPLLVFSGAWGRGKTMLAHILCVHWVVRTGKAAQVVNWPVFLSRVQYRIGLEQQRKPVPDEMEEAHVQALFDVPFLVVDDAVTGHVTRTAWAQDMLYELIEARQDPTILTTNATLGEWRRMLQEETRGNTNSASGKIADRLGGGEGSRLATVITFMRDKSFREGG